MSKIYFKSTNKNMHMLHGRQRLFSQSINMPVRHLKQVSFLFKSKYYQYNTNLYPTAAAFYHKLFLLYIVKLN